MDFKKFDMTDYFNALNEYRQNNSEEIVKQFGSLESFDEMLTMMRSREDEIGLYNTVDLYFEDDDEVETYKLVTTVRGNSMKGLISSESPLGSAIMGHRVGDRVYVRINEKAGYYVVVKRLENTTDDGSDKLRSY